MQEKEFKLANITLRGLAFGDPQKPMILALHGWLDNAASFIPLAEYLPDYYVLAVDLAGHGLSDHRGPDSHYNLMDYVYDLHELVESQGWESFILLGHSMGGIIGSIYTSCFPEKVSCYISIESFGPISKEPLSSPQHLRESIESRLKAAKSEGKHPTSLDRTIQARAKAGDLDLESATLLINRNVQRVKEGFRFRTDRRLRTISSLRLTPLQAQAFMRGISRPTLVINGDKGYEMVKKILLERQGWVLNLISAECEGGHHLHMDKPKPVAREIITFLNSSQES
ncbi:MAG: pimeloyl-ACP methyl ester carboxylesterase [Paraglaciecola sp.]|jgi:pimeloyl-ACP methyl ester carboxylesterase